MKSDMSAAAATRNRRRTTVRRIIERTDRADKPGADEGMDFGTRIQCASGRGGRRDGLDVAKQEDVARDVHLRKHEHHEREQQRETADDQ